MTRKEAELYDMYFERYKDDQELINFLDLHVKVKQTEIIIGIKTGHDIRDIAAMTAGISELREALTSEPVKKQEEKK